MCSTLRVPERYAIKDGDTLWRIGVTYGVSVDAIMALNPRLVPAQLRPGQTIKLR